MTSAGRVLRFAPIPLAASAALMAGALAACSSGGASGGGSLTTGASDADAALHSESDAATASAVGDDASPDALSIAPPLDDADAPPSDAGPGGPWIAFASTRSGNFDLYLIHPDGTGLRPLVQDLATDILPAWSPDGTKVAFSSTRSGAQQLYVVDVVSGVVSPIETGLSSATAPAFSPDGRSIALTGNGDGGGDLIYVVASDGGVATALTSGAARDSSPVWSPDGSTIYFASDRAGAFEVWAVGPNGADLRQITTGANPIGGPTISPDGTTLAFATTSAGSGVTANTRVALYALGAKSTNVLSSMGDSEPAYAKDGARIAMTTTRYDATNDDIVLVSADGGSPFRLTSDPGIDGQSAFQPLP